MNALGGVLIGVGLTLAALTLGRGRGAGAPVGALRPMCGVSIVLFERGDGEEVLIDLATGKHGFSHVAIDGCEASKSGQPLIIDCKPGLGVARRPESDYGQRRRVRVWLPLIEGREFYGCARGRVGQPYDLIGLVLPNGGPADGYVCSQLVYECLPERLRERIPAWPSSRPVSPNDLARGLGAVRGGGDVVLE